jgi:ElaB/YqjD/DUF883 family membrane-anchored ribosome-binding protein
MGRGAHANGEVSDAMREAATKLSNDLARTARDAREAADDLGEALRHSAEDVADKARSNARIANRDFRRGVRDHPVAWLGAAAGAGALLSLLMVAGRSRPN